jgi:hypothetical protein
MSRPRQQLLAGELRRRSPSSLLSGRPRRSAVRRDGEKGAKWHRGSLRAPRLSSVEPVPASLDMAGTEHARREAGALAGGEISSMNVFFTRKPKLSSASVCRRSVERT